MTAAISKDTGRQPDWTAPELGPTPTLDIHQLEAGPEPALGTDIQPLEARPEPTLSVEVRQQLGTLLRGMYDDLLGRPVPDRFIKILQRLDGPPEGERS